MIYVLIPTYNEEQNIERLRKNLDPYVQRSEVHFVFADDHSTDQTISVIGSQFGTNSCTVLPTEENKGPGDAFDRGFNWILENSENPSDVIVTMEADNTSDLGILETMLLLNERGYELVLASVYAQGGGFQKTTFIRKVISFFANMLFRSLLNLKVLTLSSFYRVYSVHKVREVKERFGTIITEQGFICMVELLLKLVKCETTVIEVPMVLESTNRVGRSKMKIMRTTMQYLRFLTKASTYKDAPEKQH